MSFLTGKSNFVKFGVVGDLPEVETLYFIRQRVAAYSFKDIDDAYDEYSIGWVSVLDMLDPSFSTGDMIVGDYVVMSLRVDERKVPPAVLKKFIAKEEKRIKEERQIPKLGRAQRVEVKERVRVELMRKAKPVPFVFDLCWNIDKGEVFFFTTNKKANALLEDFFKDTFGLMLAQKIPFTIGKSMLSSDDFSSMAEIAPTIFA